MTESLEQRLDRVESIEAIKQLKYTYCAACDDDHNGDAVAALFVDDGVWDAGERIGRAEGPEAIAALMFAIRNSGDMRNSAHQVFNPQISVDGDTGTGHWRLLMLYTSNTEKPDQRYRRVVAFYDEKYVRVDGVWRYQEMVTTVEESASYQAKDYWRDLPTAKGTRLPIYENR